MKSTFIIFTLFLLFAFSLADKLSNRKLPKGKELGTTWQKNKCYCNDKKCKKDEAPACKLITVPFKMVRCVCIKKSRNYIPIKK